MTNVSEKSEKSVEKKTATSTGATVINYKGVHHLGGIFCNVVDVKSEEEAHEELLTTVAWNQFGSEVSVGVQGPLIGGAISGSVKISSSKGKTVAENTKKKLQWHLHNSTRLQLTDEKFKECGAGKEARVCATGSKDRGTTELHEDTRISVKLSSATG